VSLSMDERRTMWFLLIVLLAAVPGVSRVTVLNTFSTYEACQPERNRVGFEMAESYPGENDFLIVCEFREKTPSVPVRDVLRQGRTVQKEWPDFSQIRFNHGRNHGGTASNLLSGQEAHTLADADKGTTRQDFRTSATTRTQSIVPSPTSGAPGIKGHPPSRKASHVSPTTHAAHFTTGTEAEWLLNGGQAAISDRGRLCPNRLRMMKNSS